MINFSHHPDISQSVEVEATPAIIGMVRKVNHLVAVESI